MIRKISLFFLATFILGCGSTPNNYNSQAKVSTNKLAIEKKQVNPVINKYSLTVNATPANARIRILNITPKYKDGIKLLKGKYRIEVSKPGHKTNVNWVTLNKDEIFNVKLEADFDYLSYVANIKWNSLNEPFRLVYDNKNKLIWALQNEYINYVEQNKPSELVKGGLYYGECNKLTSIIERDGKLILCKAGSKTNNKNNFVVGELRDLKINLQRNSWRKPYNSEFKKNNPFKKYQKYFQTYGGPTYVQSDVSGLQISTMEGPLGYECYRNELDIYGRIMRGYCDNTFYSGKPYSSYHNKGSIIIPVRKPTSKYDDIIFGNLSSTKKLSRLIKLLTEERLHVEKTAINKPKKLKKLTANRITKGEFEKTTDFNRRVQKEKERVVKLNEQNDIKYQNSLVEYNHAINAEQQNYEKKTAFNKKKTTIRKVANEVASQAITMVFGDPAFRRVKYNADKEVFEATLYSTTNDFSLRIEIPTPVSEAKTFKEKLMNNKLVPSVKFKINNGTLVFKDLSVVKNSVKQKQDFEIAKNKNTIDSYRNFLTFHNNSPMAIEAKKGIANIQEEQRKKIVMNRLTAEKRAAEQSIRAAKTEKRIAKENYDLSRLGECNVGNTIYHREKWNTTTSSGNILADNLFGAATKEEFIIVYEGVVKGFVGEKVEVIINDYGVKQTVGGGFLQPSTWRKYDLNKHADKYLGKTQFYDKARCN